jgi:surfeit locus 1 family protein
LRRLLLPIVAVIVAAVCIRLGFWQLDRLEGRRAANASIRAGLETPAAPLPQMLADAEGDASALAYRATSATGTYDAANQLRLYGRAQDGRPGDHVLTPLVLADGTAVLVDRGWIPLQDDPGPTLSGPAAPPSGPVDVTGVLLPSEEGAAFAGNDGEGSSIVRVTNVEEIDARLPGPPLLPVTLLLQEQSPPQRSGLPVPAPLPEPDEGPHLSYAIQWFAFATIAIVGYGVLALRDGREGRARTAGTGEG